MTPRYFEDFAAGDRLRSHGVTITEAMIVDYAMMYDPQPIHMDKARAQDGPFGGLIASGWQVGALAYRMVVQAGFFYGGGLASPGIETLRWTVPVRPGDTIHAEVEIVEARPSRSNPDRGVVTLAYEVKNQRGEVVMSWTGVQIILRRPAEEPEKTVNGEGA